MNRRSIWKTAGLGAAALGLLMGTAAGVHAEGASDWPTVKVEVLSFTTAELAAEESVENALNEYLVSIDAGVQVDILPLTFGDRPTQLTLLLSSQEDPLDLFCWRFYSSVSALAKNGQAISLDGYKEAYPELWEIFPEDVYKTCQVKGEQYALPGADSFGNMPTYIMKKDIAEEIGVMDLADQKITMDQLEEILAKAEEAHPELCWFTTVDQVTVHGIDNLGNDNWLGALMNRGVGETEIVDYYETEEFLNYCKKMQEWSEKGYFVNDPLNADLTDLLGQGLAGGGFVDGYSVRYVHSLMEAQQDCEMAVFQLGDFVGTNAGVYNGWCISSNCKNPDQAMKLLSLMYTDPTVCNFFTLGVEGETYAIKENGTATYPEGVTYDTVGWNVIAPWFYPNDCISIPFDTDEVDYYTNIMACWDNPDAEYSTAMGFTFDDTEVADQMKDCTESVNAFRTALLFGEVSDVEEEVTSFIDDLKSCGIDDVIAEEQRQFEEFLANK